MESSKVYFLYMEEYDSKTAHRTPKNCIDKFNRLLNHQKTPAPFVVGQIIEQDLDTGVRCIHTQLKATAKVEYEIETIESGENRKNTHTLG